jgi:radical SAM protein with 4Fe4S-binding SPASM domain
MALIAQRAQLAGAPFGAMVEVADRCNEACVHCYQIQGQRGELDTAEWKHIFDQLAELGVMLLTISGGEPTLRKDFLELVRYARELRFAVRIYSNALNITEAMARELGALAVQEVQISLYSHRAENHDAVTRVPGSFSRVESATGFLRQAGVRVVLKSPLMQSNSVEYREYIQYVESLGADFSLDPKLKPREDGDPTPTRLGIDKRTFLSVAAHTQLLERRAPSGDGPRKPCGACKGNVHVEANGDLHPCTLWNVTTGSARGGQLREAWHQNPIANQIRALTWDDLPSCRVCDLQRHCTRCFAEAEHLAGSALAPYAPACRTARWRYELATGVEPEIDCEQDYCSTEPLGPFCNAGEHRFRIEPGSNATGGRPTPERAWLGGRDSTHMSPAQLVQIRRRKGAPLTPSSSPPSDP